MHFICEPRIDEYNHYIQELCLFDDDFMCLIFENKNCVELILQIILHQSHLKVKRVLTQKDIKNIKGRSIRADVIVEDEDGNFYDIEVQRQNHKGLLRRSRYNSSLLDMSITESGEEYPELPNSCVIFIMERDIFGKGKAIYSQKVIIQETGDIIDDGTNRIFVNGNIQDDTPLGRLMHDFYCRDWKDIYYKVLREEVKKYKEGNGKEEMCEIWEEIKRKGYEQGKVQGIAQGIEQGKAQGRKQSLQEIIKNMFNNGVETEKISLYTNTSIDEIKQIITYH